MSPRLLRDSLFGTLFLLALAAWPSPAMAVNVLDGLLALQAVVQGTETFERAQATLAAGTAGEAGGPTVDIVGYIDDGSQNVLRRGLQFTTSVPATPVVRVSGGGRAFIVPPTGYLGAIPNSIHTATIFGLKAETEYTVTVSAYDALGRAGPEEVTSFTTGALPISFPPIRIPVNEQAKRTPGYILFDISSRAGLGLFSGTWLIMVDMDGEPVWYYNDRFFLTAPTDVRRISTGNLLFIGFDAVNEVSAAREINLFGADVRHWSIVDIGAGGIHSMHHELGELPNGNFITLSSFTHFVTGYPEEIGTEHLIVSDVIVEFAADGSVQYFFDVFDNLDPFRVLPGFEDTGFWEFTYGPGFNDWSHGNGVIEDPRDGGLIISLRHQDLVYKQTRDGELVWMLGTEHPSSAADDTWPFLTLTEGTPPIHQHAPQLQPEGTLLVYDNGDNFGNITSRAVEYEIDEMNLTARQVWEWVDPDYSPPLFSAALSDADRISETNVLIDDGAVVRTPSVVVSLDGAWTHIVEVNKVTQEKVFELIVRDDAEEDPEQYLSYRAEHLRSLYRPLTP